MTPGSDHPSGDRPEVAGPAVVHVQKAGEAAFRVVELPEGPVRVGRAPQCEVRLDDIDSIGDVHCLFRRRGEAWHFQPVGPAGLVWIDELPADEQAVIPSGVPFRVGHHWLTFRSARDASNDRGSFRSPIPVEPAEPAPEPQPRPAAARTPDEVPEPAAAEGGEGTADDRLKRWQNRLDQRERWIRDRQDEKRWEARWKAAGESIKAKGARPAPPGPSAAPGRPAPAPPPASTPPPVAPMTRPTIEPRAVVRPAEARPIDPPRRVFTPAARPAPPRFPAGPRAPHPAPSGGLAQPPPARPPVGFGAPAVGPRLAVALNPPAPLPPADRIDVGIAPPVARVAEPPPPPQAEVEPEVEPEVVAPVADPASVGEEAPAFAVLESDSFAEILEASIPAGSIAVEDDAGIAAGAPVEVEPGPSTIEAHPGWADDASFGTETFDIGPSTAWEEPAARVAPPAPLPARARFEPPGREARPAWAADAEAEPAPRDVSGPPDASGAEWPTARAIFAAQGRRFDGSPELAAAREPARGARKRAAIAAPTVPVAPGHWTIPLWLGLGPMAALTLVLGALGLALCWEWIGDASSASRAIRIATREAGAASPMIDLEKIPRGPWWRTTAGHLSAWAMAVERIGDGEDRSLEVRNLMDDARHVSPLAAGSRFVLESGPAAASDPIPLLFQVGRPRDAVTLAWTGRHLRKAGKDAAALGSFRSAYALALGASRRDLDAPRFDDDPQARRYALPHESLLGLVARVMAGSGAWTADQWLDALPRASTARVAAARVLRGADRAASDRILDRAILDADSAPPDAPDAGEERAALAEALALRGRWGDSMEAYRGAIEAVADDVTRRRWWINLADVARRGEDKAARARALDSARDSEITDEVTKRALELQQTLAGVAPPRAGSRP